jgi:hypothetical protein
MKTIKERVKYLLDTFPHLRDNDFKLIATYYKFEVGDTKLSAMSGLDFLQMFANGDLPHSESIRRVRQKLQEDNDYLKGENYKQRQRDSEEIKNGIKREL